MESGAIKRKVSQSEQSLCLLYALDQLGLCGNDDLWPFAARVEHMEYLPYCELLLQMEDSGEIAVLPAGTLYVGQKGKETLRLFGKRIPPSVREQIKKEAKRYRLGLINHRQVSAGYEKGAPAGWSRMMGRYFEGDTPTFLLLMDTRDKKLCDRAVTHFPAILPKILLLLQGIEASPPVNYAEDADALHKAAPGKPLLHTYTKEEIGAAVVLPGEDTLYRIQLLLANRDIACRWACACDAVADEAAKRITALFTEDVL